MKLIIILLSLLIFAAVTSVSMAQETKATTENQITSPQDDVVATEVAIHNYTTVIVNNNFATKQKSIDNYYDSEKSSYPLAVDELNHCYKSNSIKYHAVQRC